MGQYDKYKQSNYVQKSDVESPKLLTISRVEEKDVSMADQPGEMKYVINFYEDIKPWVPGISSLETIHQINGSGNTDDWTGTAIVLYVNPDVEYRGKRVGGIRCRPPKAGYTAPQPDGPPPPTDEDADAFDKAMREPGEDDGPPEY